jgi:hypothetical protein
MSINKRSGKWQVKWREGEHQRSRTFDLKGDADTFERELRRRAQLGPALVRELTRGTLTLDEFVRTGFRTHAATLAPVTRKQYARALEHHLRELVDVPLIAIDVPLLAAHQQHLLEQGRSTNTVREALTRLSGILQIEVEHGHIPGNAARAVRKVPAEPRDEVRPLAPVELEALIEGFRGPRPRDRRPGWAPRTPATRGAHGAVGQPHPRRAGHRPGAHEARRRLDAGPRRASRHRARTQALAARVRAPSRRRADRRPHDQERSRAVGLEALAARGLEGSPDATT